jgi:hypothetical protein
MMKLHGVLNYEVTNQRRRTIRLHWNTLYLWAGLLVQNYIIITRDKKGNLKKCFVFDRFLIASIDFVEFDSEIGLGWTEP